MASVADSEIPQPTFPYSGCCHGKRSGKEQHKRRLVLDVLHPWTNGSSPAQQSQQQLLRRF